MNFAEKRKIVLARFPNVPSMTGYDMVCLLQKQFNHCENDTDFNDKKDLAKRFALLTSEHNETIKGINEHDYHELRDGIGDQLTVAHFLSFKVSGLKEAVVTECAYKPVTYLEYHDLCSSKLNALEHALFVESDIDQAQQAMNEYVSQLYNIPETAKFDINDDLIEITLASLGKICETKELAERTLKAYQEKGYVVHIEESEHGFVIMVSEDCIVREEKIPKGKFLKSLEFIEADFAPTDEIPTWGTTH